MGNTVTNTICVPGTKLEILLEKVYYFPGEIIKGGILVKSDKILNNCFSVLIKRSHGILNSLIK